jgi:ubiquinone/menaquinone biosynthesis C-methylase UbiE
VLDVPCGGGVAVRGLRPDQGVDYVAADISQKMLDRTARVAAEHGVADQVTTRIADVEALPFEDRSFDLVVLNDVLQHVPEPDVAASLREIRRVLAPEGALLVRTGGSRKARRERIDWRIYDLATLAETLYGAGLRPQRATYASMLPSLVALARGRAPKAPTEHHHGIPAQDTRAAAAVAGLSLALEAAFLARTHRGVPYGHTILALAVAD